MADRVRTGRFTSNDLVAEIDLSSLLQFVASSRIYDVSFEVWPPEEEARYRPTAMTVRFILSWQPQTGNKRDEPSVKKAHYVIEQGYYGKAYAVSWKSFSKTWREYKRVSCFHYVDEYHFNRKMLLDPASSDFADKVDQILGDREGLVRYFRHSLYVMQALQRRLYTSVWNGVELPQFPNDLAPLKVQTTEPDKRLFELMSAYRSVN